MSGAITATTIAAIAGATAAAGSLAYGVYQGREQNSQQQKALKSQTTAQQTAKAAALSQQRKSENAQYAANMKTPDIAGILTRAAQAGTSGMSSTMLTGPAGVAPASLNLGKSTLLGG